MSVDLSEVWGKSLELVRRQVGDSVFELWFEPIKPVRIMNGRAEVSIPNRFFKEWLEDYHPRLLESVLSEVMARQIAVKYTIAEEENPDLQKEERRMESRKTRLAHKGIHLNPKYTFDGFVVGPSNEFANAAARAVADKPGKAYNPLFLYGGVGLGKTHLITAIGNYTVDKHRNLNMMYVSAEQFTNEVVSSFRHQKTDEFKEKYRMLDMLLIDDIQFIENKKATQEELFHTLNSLYERQKQIVVSSDRSPKEIKEVTDRLRSRFSMGLIADISAPEIETKRAIIDKKCESDLLVLPDEVKDYIAQRIKSNVREIEGCLIRLGAHASLTGAPISLSMAKRLLVDIISEDSKPLTVDTIMKTVSDYFGIKSQDMKSRKRTKDIAQPRQIAMYIARELTEQSLSEIGKNIGGKDHATVIYASKQIEKKRQEDEHFDRMMHALIEKLKP